MKIPAEGKLLRIFVGEQDKWQGQPLFQAIVQIARREGLAGATVLKGIMGFGRKSHLLTATLFRLSEDLPIVIEIVDSEEKVNQFIPHLDEMVRDGLVTLERAQVIMYRAGSIEKPHA